MELAVHKENIYIGIIINLLQRIFLSNCVRTTAVKMQFIVNAISSWEKKVKQKYE